MVSELVVGRPWATEAGTARFVERHGAGRSADAWTTIARLRLSSLGIGTYLGNADHATDARYEAAIVDAVRRGINVIDTAPNYRLGRSERVVGRALKALVDMGEIYRSEVLVASKAGFVSSDGEQPTDPLVFAQEATVGLGLAEQDELCCGCHCMAPAYLTASVERSLERLSIETLDVCFLHNPECQLHQVDRPSFMGRIRRAFEAFEQLADAGKIRVYGVATWTGLRARQQERDWLGLADLFALADSIAGTRHRFRAIEVPFNVRMPEAMSRANQPVAGELCSALEAARRLGLVTFVSGVLQQGKLARGGPDAGPKALQLARSAPGVTSALVGMCNPAHVEQNVRVLAQARLPPGALAAAMAAGRAFL